MPDKPIAMTFEEWEKCHESYNTTDPVERRRRTWQACEAAMREQLAARDEAHEKSNETVLDENEFLQKQLTAKDAEIASVIRRLLRYREHLMGCEVNRTDFCTCGMKQVADEARTILAAAQGKPKGSVSLDLEEYQ